MNKSRVTDCFLWGVVILALCAESIGDWIAVWLIGLF